MDYNKLEKVGKAYLYSQVITKFPFEFQQKQVLDQALEIFKTYLGKAGNSLPASGEEGDKFLLLGGDSYTAYEYKDGTWKQATSSSGSGGGSVPVDLSNYYTKGEVNTKISNLDSKYVKSDDTTVVKLNNENEINLQEDHYNAWLGYRGGKVTNWKFGDGTEGGLGNVYAKDFYLNDQKLSDLLGGKANDGEVVKYTDYASSSKGGVVKSSQNHGISVNVDGFLTGVTRTAEQYNSNSGYMIISKGTLENVLTSKAEDWEFTLSDGSTVTKKLVCL